MKVKRIEHIAIAVEDLDGMAAMLRDKLGIEVEYAEDIPGRGTRLAMLPVGESYIELLQGLAPASTGEARAVVTVHQALGEGVGLAVADEHQTGGHVRCQQGSTAGSSMVAPMRAAAPSPE